MDKVGGKLYKEVNNVIQSNSEGQYLNLPLNSERLEQLENTLEVFIRFSELVNVN